MPDTCSDEHAIMEGPEASGRPRYALIGCGGTGCNLVAEHVVDDVDVRIALSAEPEVLTGLQVEHSIRVMPRRLEQEAKSAWSNTRIAQTEIEGEIADMLSGVDVAFIAAGLGGYTGGWGAVMAARAGRLRNCTSICVVSEPFSVEGQTRKERAGEQGRMLMGCADGVIIVPNDIILAEAPKLPIMKAFHVMNSVMASPMNLLLAALGKGDLKRLEKCLAASDIFALDTVEWAGEHAVFSVVEQMGRSKWLGIDKRKVRSAILLVEGELLHDDLLELGSEFSKIVGKVPLLIGKTRKKVKGLRVTALVGF